MNLPSKFKSILRKILFTLLLLFAFFCGVLTGNLDRLDSRVFSLLQYQQYLPGSWQKFLPGGSAKESSGAPKEVIDGRIIHVSDGDTATLLNDAGTKKYKIRFFGMDAPESSQEYGPESRQALAERVLGEKVRLLVINIDRYGRNVGKVYRHGRYINQEMVATGNAWYYKDFARWESSLKEAEDSARKNKLGLWKGPHTPKPPWQYRKEKKEERGASSARSSFFSRSL